MALWTVGAHFSPKNVKDIMQNVKDIMQNVKVVLKNVTDHKKCKRRFSKF